MNLLLFLNTIFNLTTVYLICSKFKNLSIFFVVYFALIILNSEILSLFSIFSAKNIFTVSLIEIIFVFLFFFLNKAKFYFPNLKEELNKIKNALKLDKYLLWFLAALGIVLIVFGIIAFTIPVIEPDARYYHFVRIFSYIKQQSFNHFITNEIRNIIMPINSEIVYSYFYVFKKSDIGFGFLSYFSFFSLVISAYMLLRKLKISARRSLFAILTFSSFGHVLVQISSLQTDIVVSALTMSAIYLFVSGVNSNKLSEIYFSSLAYAIAIGTKTTALTIFPTIVLILVSYLFIYKKENKIKKLAQFFGFLLLNFLIFSSYNYILNYLDFRDFIAPKTFLNEHKIFNGIVEITASLIAVMLDFLGIKLTNEFDERAVGATVLGLYFFLPSVIYSIFLFNKKNKFLKFSAICALTFFINYIIICLTMRYYPYTVRFFVTYCALTIISLGIFYKTNKYKKIVILTSIMSMIMFAIFSPRYPIYKYSKLNYKNLEESIVKNQFWRTLAYQNSVAKYYKTFFFPTTKVAILGELDFYEVKKLLAQGYKVDVLDLKAMQERDLTKYNKILFLNLTEITNNPNRFLDENDDTIKCIKGRANIYIEKDTVFNQYCEIKEEFFKKKKLKLEYKFMYSKDLFLYQYTPIERAEKTNEHHSFTVDFISRFF